MIIIFLVHIKHLKPLKKSYSHKLVRVWFLQIGDNDVDTFDCVDIYQQPALSHPLLKGHKIQVLLYKLG